MPLSLTWNTKRVFVTYRNFLTGSKEPGTWEAVASGRIVNTLADGTRQIFRPGKVGAGSLNVTDGSPSLDVQLPIVNDPDNSPQGGEVVLTITFSAGGSEVFRLSPLTSWPDAGTDLASIVDPTAVPTAPALLLRGVAGGVAGLDGDGDVVNAAGTKIVSGGSGGVTWAAVSGKPTFAAVATSGSYTDLTGKPAVDAMGTFTLNELARVQGVNWYGLDEAPGTPQHVGPTLAQMRRIRREGIGAIRLPVAWTIEDAVLEQVLTDADTAGLRVLVECHTYGHTGGTNKTQANGGGGTLIDAAVQSTVDTWTAWCVDQANKFGRHPSYVPLDMNEPSQTGAQWEPISRQRVAALRAAGWSGLIGVSAGGGGSAAGSINNATLGHPNGWWLADDPGCFLEVHLYFSTSVVPQTNWVGLNDQVVAGTTYTGLNSRAVAAGVSGATDITTYIDKIMIQGLFGTAKWDSVPKYVGEWAFPPPYDPLDVSPLDGSVLFPTVPFTESAADKTAKLAVHQHIVDYFRSRDTGATQWAYPANWSTGYRWKTTIPQVQQLGRSNRAATSSAVGSGFNYRGAWAASTAYAVNDVVSNAGSTYLVTSAFTSGSTFATTNLAVWAAKGTDGANGANGAAGPTGAPGPGLSISNKPLTTNIFQRSALMQAGAGGSLVSGTVMLHPFFVARGGTVYDAFGFTATTAQVAGSGAGTLYFGLHANLDEFLWPDTTTLLASGSISSQTAANTNVAVPFASAVTPAQDTIYWLSSLYVAGATAPTTPAVLASVTTAAYELSAPSSTAAYNNFRGITITGQTALPTTALTYTTTGLTVSSGSNVACVYLRRSA